MEELTEQRLVKDPPEPKLKRKNLERVATGLLCAAGLNLLVNIIFNERYSNKLSELNIQANSKEGPYAQIYGAFKQKFFLEHLCSERSYSLSGFLERKCIEEGLRIDSEIKDATQKIAEYNDKRLYLEEKKKKSIERALIYGYFTK